MKKLIITGAANGIGRATVEQAIVDGYFGRLQELSATRLLN